MARRPNRYKPIKHGAHEARKGGLIVHLPGLSPLTQEHVAGRSQQEMRAITDVDDLVVQFQSRPVRKVYEVPGLEDKLPDVVYPMGEAEWVRYDCDKDDPVTRVQRGRDPSYDPDGVQGVQKPFIHKHTRRQRLYLYNQGTRQSRQGAPKVMQWPSVVGWLGDFAGCAYLDSAGKVHRINAKDGWSLWCFPGRASLLAIPDPRNGPVTSLLYWSGGALNVNWRGIEH